MSEFLGKLGLIAYYVFLYIPGREYRYRDGIQPSEWFLETFVAVLVWAFALLQVEQSGLQEGPDYWIMAFAIAYVLRLLAWFASYLWWKNIQEAESTNSG